MRNRFREQRLSHGWTQRDLAERCRAEGVHADDSQLSKIERDVFGAAPALRAVLCRLLDLPIIYFDKSERDKRQGAA